MNIFPKNNLKQIRLELGRTQEEVANAVKIDRRTLYRYESSQQCPNLYTARRLAQYFERPLDDLFPQQKD